MTPKTIAVIHELLEERSNAAKRAYTAVQARRTEIFELGDERLMEKSNEASDKAKAEYDKFRGALYEFESATITIS